ncbi:FAD-dependent oxidoreductase [Thermococcus radiotolerans]|uniref:Amine oxidase domain-containing protein n=1 Tax=Thermococcus radiotolerans TaxID=187880 RepID=A0A2Z2NBQ5_9EURY|nr:FAD-dependent oxidoreductase [Thermococcus radiotolerans]ASJ15229.1 hypothetical protein A3L10_08845 [Thermococcus radiotolerans]
MNACIIGAGISGLTAAWTLLEQVPQEFRDIHIIEKKNHVGGLVNTRYIGNKFYDFGPHIFHSHDELILSLMKQELKERGFYDIKTIAKSYWNKKFYDYPLSVDSILNLPKELQRKVLIELYKLCPNNKHEATNFSEFVRGLVGDTLYKIFFEKYTKKLWGISPTQIPSEWAPKRISFRVNDKTFFGVNEWEVYHKNGIKEITNFLFEKIQRHKNKVRLLFNSEVLSITNTGGAYKLRVLNKNTNEIVRLDCDILISSMPLDELLLKLGAKPKPLIFRSSIVVFLELNREFPILPANWIYLNEENYPFTRIFEQPSLLNKYHGNTWITIEYHINKDSKMWKMANPEIVNRTTQFLESLGLVSQEDIINWDVWKEAYTYPVLTFETLENLKYNTKLINNFKNVITVGRLGKFRYMNMDETISDTIRTIKNKIIRGA